ncbi:MAG: redox-regulated ATPase YchF [Nanoarchaeota archaeon]|nr:redox-regulated ATPase YchF [Nanoarchaeota archaeon]
MLVGVIGKPNVGKSTFFKSATLADVEIANYPFATIKPNSGIGHVRVDCVDKEFMVQCNPRTGFCINHKRFLAVELIDVAGLVPGAHEGKGLGNEFLNDLQPADALIHVIDASGGTNEKGEVVEEGSYDPAEDIRFLDKELDMWYLGIMKRGWDKFARTIQKENLNVVKTIAKQLSGLKVTEMHVEDCLKEKGLADNNPEDWNDEELFGFAQGLRKKTKPMIIAANKCDRKVSFNNIERLKKDFSEYTIIPCSADSELALREATKSKIVDYVPGNSEFIMDESKLNDKQKEALKFIKKNVLGLFGSTGVQNALNGAVFNLLNYIHVYPGGMNNLKDKDGNILPDCFLLKNGSTALDFAFRVHTDIGKHFIKAMDVKKRMPVGKEHILNDGDVIEIMTAK